MLSRKSPLKGLEAELAVLIVLKITTGQIICHKKDSKSIAMSVYFGSHLILSAMVRAKLELIKCASAVTVPPIYNLKKVLARLFVTKNL